MGSQQSALEKKHRQLFGGGYQTNQSSMSGNASSASGHRFGEPRLPMFQQRQLPASGQAPQQQQPQQQVPEGMMPMPQQPQAQPSQPPQQQQEQMPEPQQPMPSQQQPPQMEQKEMEEASRQPQPQQQQPQQQSLFARLDALAKQTAQTAKGLEESSPQDPSSQLTLSKVHESLWVPFAQWVKECEKVVTDELQDGNIIAIVMFILEVGRAQVTYSALRTLFDYLSPQGKFEDQEKLNDILQSMMKRLNDFKMSWGKPDQLMAEKCVSGDFSGVDWAKFMDRHQTPMSYQSSAQPQSLPQQQQAPQGQMERPAQPQGMPMESQPQPQPQPQQSQGPSQGMPMESRPQPQPQQGTYNL